VQQSNQFGTSGKQMWYKLKWKTLPRLEQNWAKVIRRKICKRVANLWISSVAKILKGLKID